MGFIKYLLSWIEGKPRQRQRLPFLLKGKNMEQTEIFGKIDKALHNLEASFENFQKKHNQRLQQFYTAQQRPVSLTYETKWEDQTEKKAFLNYISQGRDVSSQKSLTSQEGPKGGYFVPQPLVEHIQDRLLQVSPFRQIARVSQISTDSLELLLDKGGADVGWVSEVEERLETNAPELSKVKITTHQIYAKPRASQKLLDDASIDLESWVVSKISDKMARAENTAFLHGDGQGKPRGFLNYPLVAKGKNEFGKIEALKTGVEGGFANADVLIEALNTLKPEYLQGAVWLMPRSALSALRQLKETSTGNYLWQPGLLTGQPQTLLGHPIVVMDEMPALIMGKATPSIAFGNFHEGYQIVDRSGIHVLRDPYSAKPYVEFYATKRVGGDVINTEAIKVIHFSKE